MFGFLILSFLNPNNNIERILTYIYLNLTLKHNIFINIQQIIALLHKL